MLGIYQIVNANNVIEYGLERFYESDDMSDKYIVVYYIYNEVYFNGREINGIMARVKSKITSFKEKHLIEVLTNRIIIGEVFVETPIIDIIEKK